MSLANWLEQNVPLAELPELCKAVLPEGLKKENTRNAIARYKKIHKQIFGSYPYCLPPDPSSAELNRSWSDLQSLNATFAEFLISNKCPELLPWCMAYLTGEGNGYCETLPALYGMFVSTYLLI